MSAPSALAATCTLNGKEIPCDQMPGWFWAVSIGMTLLGLFCFIFWLRMLLDAIRNQTKDKTMWVLIIIFLNVLGAVIYYFSEKKKRNT
ncbi:PLDc_N domain-containing protein [Candidatus Peregrinibacteria bacterium]|nr:PLDc_N domain-containing protein [Candidatus Peregrinibacteria bacterium]